MGDVTQQGVITGLAATALVLAATVVRQKRLDAIDLGSFIAAYFSGNNFPASLFLCVYVFYPDPKLSQTALAGFEKYISLAGLVLFLASATGVWKLIKNAWELPSEATPSKKKDEDKDKEDKDK